MDYAKLAFFASLSVVTVGGAFAYGVLAHRSNLFPVPQLETIYDMMSEVVNPSDNVLKAGEATHADPIATLLPEELQPGLILVAENVSRRQTAVRVIDRDGRVIHEWLPVWSEIWGKFDGTFPERPVKGTYLHGVELLPDGSLVANFEHQSTFRLDICGEVLWKLDNLGHHSVHFAEDETIWVTAEDNIQYGETGFPNHRAPLRSWTLQNISLDGEVLRTIPVIDVFLKNGLEGYLYTTSRLNLAPIATGDTLHLNDVETFPSTLESDIFEPGDVMMSLRNISSVVVFDPDTLKVKLISTGGFTRQHDPDFIDGDRISVFDNRNFTVDEMTGPPASRIVEIDARTGQVHPVLDKTAEEPFFTEIMGDHQRLENGDILVTPSGEGLVLEFTPDGRLAWRYDNRTDDKHNEFVLNATVLPEFMDEEFFAEKSAVCVGN